MLKRTAVESICSWLRDPGRRLAARVMLAMAIVAAFIGVGAQGPTPSVLATASIEQGEAGVAAPAGREPIRSVSLNVSPPSSCGWASGFHGSGLSGTVHSLVAYDDGGGKALYVGGSFTAAGDVDVNRIAKWDGSGWSALTGPAGTGMNDRVTALAAFDDGGGEALYAAGWFTTAGGVEVNGIAKWDGIAWSALSGPWDTGVSFPIWSNPGQANALAVYNDGGGEALYAAGWFTTAGGVEVNGIAKWDGTAWSALSGPWDTGVSLLGSSSWGLVNALSVYNDGDGEALYVGGVFTDAGGVPVYGIAKWDGTAWSALRGPLGTGVGLFDDRQRPEMGVYSLTVYDDGGGEALYVGGDFVIAGGVKTNGIAKWDGTDWSALRGSSGDLWPLGVYSLAVHDDGGGEALYAGGQFTAGQVQMDHVARWDGTDWWALGGPSGTGMNDDVLALAVYDDGGDEALYAGGEFTIAGGVEANRVAKWDGTGWSALSGPPGMGTDNWVSALAVYDDGGGEALYAGGYFTTAGGVQTDYVAKSDGTAWSPLSGPSGTGMNDSVSALAVYDDGGGEALYAGGFFTTAAGLRVDYIAKWDGTGWSALSGPSGTGTSTFARALAVYDDGGGEALYAGGSFATAGGVEVLGVAKWDGTDWSPLSGPSGTGMDGQVWALAVFDDGSGEALYAGGGFDTAGGVEVNGIAKWDGTGWSALSGPSGTGVGLLHGTVRALAMYDDGAGKALYAGGYFITAGAIEVHGIAKWDGTSWSALTGPSGTGVKTSSVHTGSVDALAVYDGGGGETLHAGGFFRTAGGVEVNNIAKWDGKDWSALSGPSGTGMNSPVFALAVYDDGGGAALYAGGGFTTAGGVVSWFLGRFGTCSIFSDGFESGDTAAWSRTYGGS